MQPGAQRWTDALAREGDAAAGRGGGVWAKAGAHCVCRLDLQRLSLRHAHHLRQRHPVRRRPCVPHRRRWQRPGRRRKLRMRLHEEVRSSGTGRHCWAWATLARLRRRDNRLRLVRKAPSPIPPLVRRWWCATASSHCCPLTGGGLRITIPSTSSRSRRRNSKSSSSSPLSASSGMCICPSF